MVTKWVGEATRAAAKPDTPAVLRTSELSEIKGIGTVSQ